jgi:hypothetical protein
MKQKDMLKAGQVDELKPLEVRLRSNNAYLFSRYKYRNLSLKHN